MIPIKLNGFIDELKGSTEDNSVQWHAGADEAYFCNHKRFGLFLRYEFDPDREQSYYAFRISVDGKDTPFMVTDSENDYDRMRDLYQAVIVNANNTVQDLTEFFE